MCAYIVSDDGRAVINKGAQMSALSRVDLDRQLDVLRLAKMGNRDAQRWWNDWQREAPADARLVAEYDRVTKAEQAEARDSVDALLTKGRMTPGKTAKRSKFESKSKAALSQKDRQKALRASIKSDLNSPDPFTRETARRLLERM